MSDVLIRVEGACGRITLNRPRAINALTLEMTRAIASAMFSWAEDATVRFVLLDGAGDRGLCAGGDIRALYEAVRRGDWEAVTTFFREEYALNYLIATYPKPTIALMDGVVMGGGIGVSAHGSRRVVTERSALAMPETAIGFLPDVGGTYLLGRAPDELGTYLALTASRAGAADAILCGLADMFVPSSQLPALTAEIVQCATAEEADACLYRFAAEPPPGAFPGQVSWIDNSFSHTSVEEIVSALKAHPEPAAHQAAAEIATKSPTSLKVTLHALRLARSSRDLKACLATEALAGMKLLHEPDFLEGVRAAVIDKDRNPRWSPARLEEISSERVDGFFTPAGS